MIIAVLPAMLQGVPYTECIALTGSGPFVLVSNNLAKGTAKIVGDNLCVTIPSPESAIDFVAEIKGSCVDCKTVTIKAEIRYSESATLCVCTPVTIPAQTIPPLIVGQYFAAIEVRGTPPLELCGGAAPRCLKIELKGNIVQVSGRYDGIGDIKFSVKNACTCDCVVLTIPEAV
jgi:hypothetical protein